MDYLVLLRVFLDLRPKSARCYRAIIGEWANYRGAGELAEVIGQASRLEAQGYISFLREKKLPDGSRPAEKTVAKKHAILRHFYAFLISHGAITSNPFDFPGAKSFKTNEKRETRLIDFSAVLKMLRLPDPLTKSGQRDRAILALLFGAGLRRGEVVKLAVGDCKISQAGSFYVTLRETKNGSDADQALPDWAAFAMASLRDQRIQDGADPASPLFVRYLGPLESPTGSSISASTLYNIFKRYCKAAGLPREIYPHCARATAITKLLSDGNFSYREVQEFSRHSSIAMVERYDKRFFGVDKNPGRKLKY